MNGETITRTHGLCDKWRGQTDWQLDGCKNHTKVHATQAIISPRTFVIARPCFDFRLAKKGHEKQFLLMTKEATFAYGEQICLWLSLEHDMSQPHDICLDEMNICSSRLCPVIFVASLTLIDGRVYLASDYSSKNGRLRKHIAIEFPDNSSFTNVALLDGRIYYATKRCHVFAMGVQLLGSKYWRIYSWGFNCCGQLGFGGKDVRDTPCFVAFPNLLWLANYFPFFYSKMVMFGDVVLISMVNLVLVIIFNKSKLTKIPLKCQQIAMFKIPKTFNWHMIGSSYLRGESCNWSS
ncbi:hypothetical protein DERF_012319 [Dermatophagoides farinae]|uniref:Uncharacterized protein n=1 Tax=Dermatophagoides farinae TaxID=6954 RepID=A0A922HPQ4_DERFA|nr:hypothetical protein DERF_012319 [Dermatophagoides farinae]